MDAVITYVNGLDPLWQRDFQSRVGEGAVLRRYRDWGTLKYLLRGIERCMPFLRNVFLVVSRESQYPVWADKANLKMVLHKDIIPKEFLPTFNSCSIEMFLHRIEGLDEEFLYFNDDMFPVMECKSEDFFREGKAIIGFSSHLAASGLYKKQTRNSDLLSRKMAAYHWSPFFVRPQHTCSPMLKSASAQLYDEAENTILSTITPLRTERNLNQYLFIDYLKFTGRTANGRISNRHLSPKVHSKEKIARSILNPSTKLININDVDMDEESFEQYRQATIGAFESHFPTKSRFEQ